MAQRKVFYKGPWYSQGPFHSSVCQYNCQENFVWWSALHDYSVSGSPKSYEDSRKFLKFLFLKVSFKNLKCLMVCGIELSNEFSQEIGALNLDVFHIRNFRYHTSLASLFFPLLLFPENAICSASWWGSGCVNPPKELKKLVIYCPKSSKDMIERRRSIYAGLCINVKTAMLLRKCKHFCPFHIQIGS